MVYKVEVGTGVNGKTAIEQYHSPTAPLSVLRLLPMLPGLLLRWQNLGQPHEDLLPSQKLQSKRHQKIQDYADQCSI